MNALAKAKQFFSTGKITAELNGPTSSRLRNSLRCLWGVSVAATLGAAYAIASAQALAPAVDATLSPLEHGIGVAKAIPAPWARKIVWNSFNGSPDGEKIAATRNFNKLGFSARCNIEFNTGNTSKNSAEVLLLPGLNLKLQAEFLMLHEVAHCYSRSGEGGTRADIQPPRGAVYTPITTTPLNTLVLSLAGEAEADVSALLWMSKRYPERSAEIVSSVRQGRLLAHDADSDGGGADDYYTLVAIDYLALKLNKMPASELAGMTADDIQKLAERASLESAKAYRKAITPLRLMVSHGIPDESQVHIVTYQGGVAVTEMVKALSGQQGEKLTLLVEVAHLPRLLAASALSREAGHADKAKGGR